MPSLVDYRNLRLKFVFFLALLLAPLIWGVSIWSLVQTYLPVNRIPIDRVLATIVAVSQASDGNSLDVEFFTGKRRNRVSVTVSRWDFEKYQPNQTIAIIRDDSSSARFEYCLYSDFLRTRHMEQAALWMGATIPVMLVFWFWKIRPQFGSMTRDVVEENRSA